ncbi:hypothetical protein H8R23_04195 [Flavobacterium sp. F-380]|uniref:Uncharacterized protein n=1 Tax=Flavobacterium kayseriense TaxID=2764714 RepID=A0ABR7J551_9FLAO|nr:hypothetical protein [Flavobacterium kayseriense]MBC5840597.1 hypothetical protein [Flavobacterium kayseriense]MBC5846733.1 hypothetical protein [Flavobacterium kayseriense]MBU0942725.1 hypothetical protein [Bacteroidota bacterium]
MSNNKIVKQCLFFMALFVSFASYAHQPDLSTAVLSKTDDGKYILQITSSLSAFEGEIDYLYSKGAYKTPEDFIKLVVDHFNKNVFFIVNEKDTLKFGKPLVLLGHESKLVVEVLNFPKNTNSFYFRNTMFKDMPHNQMAVMMLIEGFPKEQYILANENEQTIQLELKEGAWVTNDSDELKMKNVLYISFFLILAMLPLVYIRYRHRKNYRK